MSEQSLVFTAGMSRQLRQPVAIRVERRLRGMRTCTRCGQPFHPQILTTHDDDYLTGWRLSTCSRCTRHDQQQVDLREAAWWRGRVA